MLPDRVSNPEPLTYESGALSIALRGPAQILLTLLHSEKPNLCGVLAVLSATELKYKLSYCFDKVNVYPKFHENLSGA